jgi:nucleotide-binding universal stress UspA family protein
MDKHFLLTVGDEQTAVHGLRFLREFFDRKDSIRLTLFYVAPATKEWLQPGNPFFPDRTVQARIEDIKNTRGHEALVRVKARAEEYGFRPDLVRTRIVFSRLGTVSDIINEGRQGLYDAVILERMGVAWFGDAFANDVGRQLLGHRFEFPIWVCLRPEVGRSNVLLCVDGSDAAFRAADHVGRIVAGEPRHSVTVLHVRTDLDKSGEEVESILSRGRQAVLAGGVDASRVRTLVVDGKRVTDEVLALMAREHYAAVAMGRILPGEGEHRGGLAAAFFGAPGPSLLNDCAECVVWLQE